MEVIEVVCQIRHGIYCSSSHWSSDGYVWKGTPFRNMIAGPFCDKPLPQMTIQDYILMKQILQDFIKGYDYKGEEVEELDSDIREDWVLFCTDRLNEVFSEKYKIIFGESETPMADCSIKLMDLLDERINTYLLLLSDIQSMWHSFKSLYMKDVLEKYEELIKLIEFTQEHINANEKRLFFTKHLKNLVSSNHFELFDLNVPLKSVYYCTNGDKINCRTDFTHIEDRCSSYNLYALDIPFCNKDVKELELFIKKGARKMNSTLSDEASILIYTEALRNLINTGDYGNIDFNQPILECPLSVPRYTTLHLKSQTASSKFDEVRTDKPLRVYLYALDFALWAQDSTLFINLMKLGVNRYSNFIQNEVPLYFIENAIRDFIAKENSYDFNTPILDFDLQIDFPLLPPFDKGLTSFAQNNKTEQKYIYPLDFAIRIRDGALVDILLNRGAKKLSSIADMDFDFDWLWEHCIILFYRFSETPFLNSAKEFPHPVYDIKFSEIKALFEHMEYLAEEENLDFANATSDMKICGYTFTLQQLNNMKKVLFDIYSTYRWATYKYEPYIYQMDSDRYFREHLNKFFPHH